MAQEWQYQFSYAQIAQSAGATIAQARESTARLIAMGLIVIVADGGPDDDALHTAIMCGPEHVERKEQP